MTKPIIGIGIWLLSASLVVAAGAQSRDFGPTEGSKPAGADALNYRILWSDPLQKRAMFLPQGVLDQSSLELLPLSQSDIRAIRGILSQTETLRAKGKRPQDLCSQFTHDLKAEHEPRPGSLPLAEILGRSGITVLGQVIAIAPGWHAQLARATSMVYLEIEDVIFEHPNAGSGNFYRPGDVLGFSHPQAVIDIDQQILCSKTSEGIYQPEIGHQLLLHGFSHEHDRSYFYGTPFRVTDGFVDSTAYGFVRERVDIPLPHLRAEIETFSREAH